jgi:hypothetical protein
MALETAMVHAIIAPAGARIRDASRNIALQQAELMRNRMLLLVFRYALRIAEEAMATIIAGRFEQQSQAEDAAAQLQRAGIAPDRISTFYVTPAGQHAGFPVGGDQYQSPGAEESPQGTAAGMAAGGAVGAAIGAVTTPLTGPLGAVTGALVGAHVGSLAGSMEKMKEDGTAADENPVPIRHAGMMTAVSVPDAADENKAIGILRSLGAQDIERAEGTIANGDWEDFDPVAPPTLVQAQAGPQP